MRIRFSLLTWMGIRIRLFTLMQFLIKVMQICDHCSKDPPRLHFEPLWPPRLHFEPQQLLNFDPDPDPPNDLDADPNPDPDFYSDAVIDSDTACQNYPDPANPALLKSVHRADSVE
jgi:hypothetical protein